jgi:poly(hydroxyalkanoate) depolymerase family esterase
MDEDRMATMAEATRLTREGRIPEAMTLIQRTLGSRGGGGGPSEGVDGRTRAPVPSFRTTETGSPSRVAGRSPDNALPVLAVHGLKHVRPARANGGLDVRSPGAQFIDCRYTNAAGARTYKLYVPSTYRGQNVPLVVMLHGGTQSVGDFAAGTRMNELAERDMFLVAYPEQTPSANNMKYWNWFQPGHQVAGAGEPSLIAGITQQIMSRYSVDASRVYVAGFSAGGAMAAVMAATYPDLYAAVGVHSGLPYGAAHDLPSAFAAMSKGPTTPTKGPVRGVPLIVFLGDHDPVVGHVNADCLVSDGLRTIGAGAVRSAVQGRVRDGHAYTRTVYKDAKGKTLIEQWIVHQAGHAWSGGSTHGSYTDSQGPDASAELIRFFREHPHEVPGS